MAKHCNNQKLCIAVNEAVEFDLSNLFCHFKEDIVSHWNDVTGDFNELINGGTYTDCNGNQVSFLGVKRMLIYYAYARYVIINNFDDTPNGGVTKTNEFSIPKPLKELQVISNRYRAMSKQIYETLIKPYLCLNKDKFVNFDSSKCDACGCGNGCDKGENTKGYGIVGVNIGE